MNHNSFESGSRIVRINGHRDIKLSGSDTSRDLAKFLPAENDDDKAAASTSTSPLYEEEKTEIIYGQENVINWVLRTLPTVTKTIDQCGDRNGPSILLLNEQIWQKHIEMHNRGVRQRLVVEITKENIIHCKKLMQYQEVRHLDGLIGYLSVLDGRLVTSTAYGEESKILPHLVTSTVRVLVEQHRYFFETLWKKAIPAKQRIREIEEGAKREFVETIRDPSEIQKIGFDLIKKAEEEILIFFSTHNAFFLQQKAIGGVLDLLKEAVSPLGNVKIRILMAAADDNTNRMTTVTEERMQQLKELGIDVRRITETQRQENFLQKNNLTLLIVDQSSYLTVELNDDTKGETSDEGEEDAIGLATYSNSEATVFAYISIFENLWMRTQV
jgi:two-component system, OmpR family, sensor histidine kinase VicK